jgi:hypothetical protein
VHTVLGWVCLLGLGAMRSPFLPQEYATIVPLIAATVLLARSSFSVKDVTLYVAAWLVLSFSLPFEQTSSRFGTTALVITVIQIVGVLILVLAGKAAAARGVDGDPPL